MFVCVGKLAGFLFVIVASTTLQVFAQDRSGRIGGRVDDAKTGLPLAGVNVVILQTALGTTTDSLGNFSMSTEPGNHTIRFSRVGYEPQERQLKIDPGKSVPHIHVSLKATVYLADEVMISADRWAASPGIHRMEEKNLQYIPNIYSDALRSVTIFPGVTSNNELTSAYNVRGQNFVSNLIYLDGFEIYRPFLVQQGIEESQSAVNQNMVGNMTFYDGAFPAEYGDRMASALVVEYKRVQEPGLGGEVNADLLNFGLTLHDRIGALSWIAGFRYAYPSWFTSVLQTKGRYIPRYADFQLLASYSFPGDVELEMLFMRAKNTFDLTPQKWTGDFAVNAWYAFQRIVLDFSGAESYGYDSNLLGVRLTAPLDHGSRIAVSFAYYSDKEYYDEDISYDVMYSPDAYHPGDNVSRLGTGYEFAANMLDMNRLEFRTDYDFDQGTRHTKGGIAVATSLMNNVLNESGSYIPPPGPAYASYGQQGFRFNSVSGYLEEKIVPFSSLAFNLGVRALKYYFTEEFLLSPRASASFKPDSSNSLSFGWGYYYQPPYFYETRNKTPEEAEGLISQRAVHYQLRYEKEFENDTRVSGEAYYKSLSRLLPYYYTNQLELEYGDSNNYNGYAYGFDLQYKGKFSQRLDTWIGYGYMVARDRRENGPYQRSLLDQTHTIRIFLQDAMPEIHNSQAHVRILFGTGYNYHPMMNVSGPDNKIQTVPAFDLVYPYPFYYRIDMGLTMKFDIPSKRVVTLSAEVLNMFNKNNIVSYSWYTIPEVFSAPLEIPNLLSARFFNVGVRVEF